jgi:hypothetical protein
MPEYFMRVDALNHANFIFDTYDISRIRGGSYILLDVIEKKLTKKFQDRIKPISTAASQGIFSFDAPDNDPAYPDTLRREILTFLQEATEGHATFVVAIEKSCADFKILLEKLEAQVHRMQWRFPSVSIPEFNATDQECYLDGWRPGTSNYFADPNVKNAKVSASAQFRRERGRELKQRLFYELLGDEKYQDSLCVKDLERLANDKSQGILDGKIAYIHIDGNSFTRIRRKLCTSRELRGDFDKAIKEGCHKQFIRELLRHADLDPTFKTTDGKGQEALRIEILLWGGDEMTLIVPAWKGMEVMKLFYDQSEQLSFQDHKLSNRAAIIFCHHNMPILEIQKIAENLLQRAKKDIQEDIKSLYLENGPSEEFAPSQNPDLLTLIWDPRGDAFHYLVLESYDALGGSLDKVLSGYYRGIAYPDLLIHADEIEKIVSAVKTLKKYLSFGQVIKVIECYQKDPPVSPAEQIEHMLKLIPRGQQDKVKTAIKELTENHPGRWYLLGDLWNYIVEGGSHE